MIYPLREASAWARSRHEQGCQHVQTPPLTPRLPAAAGRHRSTHRSRHRGSRGAARSPGLHHLPETPPSTAGMPAGRVFSASHRRRWAAAAPLPRRGAGEAGRSPLASPFLLPGYNYTSPGRLRKYQLLPPSASRNSKRHSRAHFACTGLRTATQTLPPARQRLAQPRHSPGTAPALLVATSPAGPGLCPSARVSRRWWPGKGRWGGDERAGNGRRFDRAERALPAAVCLAIRLGRTANTWSGGWPRGWGGRRVHPCPCAPTSVGDPPLWAKSISQGILSRGVLAPRAPAHRGWDAAAPAAALGSPCAARHRPSPGCQPHHALAHPGGMGTATCVGTEPPHRGTQGHVPRGAEPAALISRRAACWLRVTRTVTTPLHRDLPPLPTQPRLSRGAAPAVPLLGDTRDVVHPTNPPAWPGSPRRAPVPSHSPPRGEG